MGDAESPPLAAATKDVQESTQDLLLVNADVSAKAALNVSENATGNATAMAESAGELAMNSLSEDAMNAAAEMELVEEDDEVKDMQVIFLDSNESVALDENATDADDEVESGEEVMEGNVTELLATMGPSTFAKKEKK